MRRREFKDVLERCTRRKREPEGKDLIKRNRICLSAHTRHLQQRLDLGRERKAGSPSRVEQWPDAHAVAREDDLTPAAIPNRECEIPVEPRHAIRSQLLVKMHYDLGITFRPQFVASRPKFITQFDIVEDLTIEGNPNRG